jgi:EAL domain-containing protein (putative c-di-GMP-specific phosphodiesterase class I)
MEPPRRWQGSAVLGELWEAIIEDRIVVHYQPQYELATGRISGVEALARFEDRSGKLRLPGEFIVAAEECGLVVPLGRSVIHQACRDMAGWRAQGLRLERTAINLSAHQLNKDSGLVSYVSTTLVKSGLSWCDIEFELTERQLLEAESPGMFSLATMVAMGARLALDDFGMGFSSLGYLTTFDVHTIKLDREMIRRVPHETRPTRIASHVLALARDLSLEVVAEGLETDAQREYLVNAGCRYAQGFRLAPPMLPRDVARLLNADRLSDPNSLG